jgi:DNA-binding transcriptional MerR regulator
MRPLAIGALADQTGVKIPTIRYYESVGLIPPAPRADNNRRLYDDEAVRRLCFIRHARELGFEIDAIRQLLALADDPDRPCEQADTIAREHLQNIDNKIARLVALRAEVQRMTEECGHERIADCRVIEVLADHGECLNESH